MATNIGSRFGRYEILGVLGQGGFATVYRARDTALQRDVALKALLPHLATDDSVVQRFLAEARTLAGFRHPNIVTVFDVGEADGRPFFAMELVDGHTLSEIFPAGSQASVDDLGTIIAGVAAAVDYLHAAGLVHRDIKPANIMVDASGRVLLMDFGIARALDMAQVTRTGTSLGTPEYMAPEQVRGLQVGPAADIYALGVLVYRLLAGHAPFTGDTGYVLYAHTQEPPPPLPDERPDLPPSVYAAVAMALAKDPSARPRSAAAFAAQYADGGATSIVVPAPVTPVTPPPAWQQESSGFYTRPTPTPATHQTEPWQQVVLTAPPDSAPVPQPQARARRPVALWIAVAAVLVAVTGGVVVATRGGSSPPGSPTAAQGSPSSTPILPLIAGASPTTGFTSVATPAPAGNATSIARPTTPATNVATVAATKSASASPPPSATRLVATAVSTVTATRAPTIIVTAPPPQVTAASTGQMLVVTQQFGAALRDAPSSDATIIAVASCGETLSVSQVGNGWYQVLRGGRFLWVGAARVADARGAPAFDCRGAVTFQPGEDVITMVASGCLSLRQTASRDAPFNVCVDNGHHYTILNGPISVNDEDWFEVTSPTTGSGWVLAQFLRPSR